MLQAAMRGCDGGSNARTSVRRSPRLLSQPTTTVQKPLCVKLLTGAGLQQNLKGHCTSGCTCSRENSHALASASGRQHTPHMLSTATTAVSASAPPSSPVRDGANGPLGRSSNSGGSGGNQSDEYFANVGKAIVTLRDDLPQLFAKDLDYSIYRQDLVAVVAGLPPCRGVDTYRRTHAALRMAGRIMFRRLDVQVQRLWQPSDGLLRVRCAAVGCPWLSLTGNSNDNPRIEFISTYRFDRRGKIYQHNIDTVIPPEPRPLLAPVGAALSGARNGDIMQR